MNGSSSYIPSNRVRYPNALFNKTSPINNISPKLPILSNKKAKLYKPRSNIKICKTMTDISNYSKSNQTRSKTLTKINYLKKETNNHKKISLGNVLYSHENSGYRNYLRAKSYSKKQLQLRNTSDLSNLLAKQVYSKNQH
jgi:hypothetical protein